MSAISVVSPSWLALRGRADAQARSGGLAAKAARRMPAGPIVVHDLGSGTGAMMHWLAPRLRGPQSWVLHDADAGILSHLDPEPAADASGVPVSVRTSVEELAGLPADALADASLVTASALLDVLTREEAGAIVDACVAADAPALFSLSVSGRVELDPTELRDEVFASAFNEHQRRVADGRQLLGPDAVEIVTELFAAAGWSVRTADTPWILGPAERDLIADWLEGWLDAATEQRQELRESVVEYRQRRRAELAADRLHVVVHHRDMLAWRR